MERSRLIWAVCLNCPVPKVCPRLSMGLLPCIRAAPVICVPTPPSHQQAPLLVTPHNLCHGVCQCVFSHCSSLPPCKAAAGSEGGGWAEPRRQTCNVDLLAAINISKVSRPNYKKKKTDIFAKLKLGAQHCRFPIHAEILELCRVHWPRCIMHGACLV